MSEPRRRWGRRTGQVYLLRVELLEDLGDWEGASTTPENRLKGILKALLRWHGAKCIAQPEEVTETTP